MGLSNYNIDTGGGEKDSTHTKSDKDSLYYSYMNDDGDKKTVYW